jgi:hypothetical protein
VLSEPQVQFGLSQPTDWVISSPLRHVRYAGINHSQFKAWDRDV